MRRPAAARAAAVRRTVAADDRWTAPELREIHDDLSATLAQMIDEQSQAMADIDDLQQRAGDGAGDDQADAGTKTFEREHELSLASNRQDMMLQVQHALERLAAGTYGNCEACGHPITKARLQAFPSATLCVSCKQREERH